MLEQIVVREQGISIWVTIWVGYQVDYVECVEVVEQIIGQVNFYCFYRYFVGLQCNQCYQQIVEVRDR